MAENPIFDPEKLLAGDLAKLEKAQLLELIKKLCKTAVSECGENGFRGGFRPGNIYTAEDGRVAVGPAGKAGEEGWTKLELEFMAPEMFWSGEKSAAADVYSIGLIMYTGLNGGHLPFLPESDEPTAEERVNALRTRMNGSLPPTPEGVDEGLAEILASCLAFEVGKRYESSAELLKALWSYCGDEPEELPEKTETPVIAETVKEPEPETKPEPTPEPKPENKPEPKPEKAPEPPKKPTPEPKPEKKAKPAMNMHQKRSAVVSCITLAAIALLLTGTGFARDYIDISLPEPVIEAPQPTADATPEPTPTPTAEPTAEPTPPPQPERHYSLYIEDVSWDEAERKCMDLGGHLATIRSAEDYERICELLHSTDADYVWIGCYRNADGTLRWTTGESSEYFNWAAGEPSLSDSYDGAAEDYVMLVKQPDGTWLYNDSRMDPMADYSRFYSGKLAYICQMG